MLILTRVSRIFDNNEVESHQQVIEKMPESARRIGTAFYDFPDDTIRSTVLDTSAVGKIDKPSYEGKEFSSWNDAALHATKKELHLV